MQGAIYGHQKKREKQCVLLTNQSLRLILLYRVRENDSSIFCRAFDSSMPHLCQQYAAPHYLAFVEFQQHVTRS